MGRIGGVDGVALETEKWIHVLRKLGHEVFLIAGQFQKNVIDPEHQFFLPVLSFASAQCKWEQNKAYLNPDSNAGSLVGDIEAAAGKIAKTIVKWIKRKEIDILISENANALPFHVSMGVAIRQVVEELNIPTICHDHDFAWERGDRYISPHAELNELVKRSFPLIHPRAIHAPINLAAEEALKANFYADTLLVPNVMDFHNSYGSKTEYNTTLPKDIGLAEGDLPLFQVTRIIPRKRIDTAIDLISRIDNPKVKLVITGDHRDDTQHYYNTLLERVHELKLSDRVVFGARWIKEENRQGPSGRKIYTLSDAYAHAVACTYFSHYEGFGNAFVEAIVARKPIFVNNYKPVFWPDIGSKGFKVVMIENNQLTDDSIAEMQEIIYNTRMQEEIGEHNFELGRKLFSYEVLADKLTGLIGRVY